MGYAIAASGLFAGAVTILLVVRSLVAVKRYGKMDWREANRAIAVDRTAARLSILREAKEKAGLE